RRIPRSNPLTSRNKLQRIAKHVIYCPQTCGSKLATRSYSLPLVALIVMRVVPCTKHAEGSPGVIHSPAETNFNVSPNL
ncbi:MAG TPA: hypothetical protein VD884_06795, partial [Ohtaekwangia sp.]|nr:hypothetical protein [Ohtaekwangia sp.]